MTEFLPTPEGAEQVIRAARRRRTAKLGGLSTSLVAVACGLALVLSAGSPRSAPAPDRLAATDEPTPTSSGETSPAPSRESSPEPSAAPQPTPEPEPDDSPWPSPSAIPVRTWSDERRTSPIHRVERDMGQADLCDDGVSQGVNGYCLRTFEPGVVHRGEPVDLGGEVCVPSTGRTLTVELDSTREADIAVSALGTNLWRGGDGLTYTSPGPTLVVEPGRCVGWLSSWDTRDREGFVVPPGDYELSFGFTGKSMSAATGTMITVVD